MSLVHRQSLLGEIAVRQCPRWAPRHPRPCKPALIFSNVQQRVMQQILQGWLEGSEVRLCCCFKLQSDVISQHGRALCKGRK